MAFQDQQEWDQDNSQTSRKRSKPLLPEPFERFSLGARQFSILFRPLAELFGKFLPNQDIKSYLTQLSEEQKTELDVRTNRLVKRSCQDQYFEASEFNWEADAWQNVFCRIRDDDTFRMLDKRPYEFIERDMDNNTISVKRRIPDTTMGLRSYDEDDLNHGYTCSVADCNVNHDSMQPNESLLRSRILEQMETRDCGLIVDGIWGEANLMFPFAVYEAKKSMSTWEQAEEQIHHACKTYLAMLDDLARSPTDVTKYQSKESERYQLFAFTSCGSRWKVYVAWCFHGSCHIETIWDGDVKDFSRAYELNCIVDQIHGYAAKQHREFVIKHLETWLQHAEAREINLKEEFFRFFFDEVPDDFPRPEWYKIKEASKAATKAKAAKTRKANRSLISPDSSLNDDTYLQQLSKGKKTSAKLDVTQFRMKRRPGRPKKQQRGKGIMKPGAQLQAKRGRGRPRKDIGKIEPKRRSQRISKLRMS